MERWVPVDRRNGRRMSQGVWPSREALEAAIAAWKERDARGGRPDLIRKVPYLVPAQLHGNGHETEFFIWDTPEDGWVTIQGGSEGETIQINALPVTLRRLAQAIQDYYMPGEGQ
jgi:hypothetical protein